MAEENSDLEKLKKRLYKEKSDLNERTERKELSKFSQKPLEEYWKKKEEPKDEQEKIKRGMVFAKKIRRKKNRFGAFLVLVFCLFLFSGLFLYFFGEKIIWGNNIVSSKKIDITIEGPSSISSGEYNKWYLFVTNNNEVGLEAADLIINYPEGSLASDGEILIKERKSIPSISSGETKERELSFFSVGEVDEEKKLGIILEYRLEGSNAIFAKSIEHVVKLSRSPVGISLKFPTEVESGQEVKLVVEYVSNSEVVLKDLFFKMQYPPGFRFIESSIKPISGNSKWLIGDLSPKEERTFEISGILEGQNLMQLDFRAEIGFDSDGQELVVGSQASSVLLKRPFMGLLFLIDGQDVDSVYPGRVAVSFPWKNNLFTEIRNAVVEVKLVGDIIDFKTLAVSEGFYRAYDNTIVWNASSLPILREIVPGGEGLVNFSFDLKDPFPVKTSGDRNFIIKLNGLMLGQQIDSEGSIVEVRSSSKKEIKIASNVQLSSRLSYVSGPLPPKVGQETVYEATWSISSLYNDISDVVVKASLLPYVSFKGVVGSEEGQISYSDSTDDVVWEPGAVRAGSGVLTPAREISFQVGVVPAINQINTSLLLVTQTFLDSYDVFTGLLIKDSTDLLKMGSISEAQVDNSLGRVVE